MGFDAGKDLGVEAAKAEIGHNKSLVLAGREMLAQQLPGLGAGF
jgi:hypothetical protein